MKKICLFLLAYSTFVVGAFCQNENNIWVFGTNSGIDFNSGSPTAIFTNINGYGEANASVCDGSGNLLFYTEGSSVWDRNGVLMPNGTDLTGIPAASGISPTTSTGQGALIVPIPGTVNKYYIFSLTSTEFGINGGRLYYSIVDMNLNGGLGDIVATQKGVLIDINMTEKMIATTGEHCNIWILTTSMTEPVFKAFEITDAGLNTNPIISNVGSGNSVSGAFGTMAISPDRKKIAATQFFTNSASIYDFNSLTGIVSNPVLLMPGVNNAYGVSFSTDNSKLYIVRHLQNELLQYNLSSNVPATIIASAINVGFCGFSQLKPGPDDKIYFQGGSGLSVINNPNFSGLACNVQYGVVPLIAGSFFYAGFPNQVPVIYYDSVKTTKTIAAPCFATDMTLYADNSTTGWNYEWNTGVSGATYVANGPGTYWVTYRTIPCQVHTDTFHVNFPNGVLPQLQISSSCKNTADGKVWASTFPGDTVSYHYTWINEANDTLSVTDTLQGQASGNYSVYMSTVNCDTVIPFFIPEEGALVSFDMPPIVCMEEAVTFQNTSDNYYATFRWFFGYQDSTAITSPTHYFADPGTYQVMLIGKGDRCVDTAYKNIIVDPIVSGIFHPSPKEICMGDAVDFILQTDYTAVGLRHRFGDGTEMSTLPESLLRHAYDQAGIMPVTIITQFRACPDVAYTDTVTVYDLPEVYLGTDTFLCLNGRPLTLKNERTISYIHHYKWNTGDTSSTLKVTHPGTYSLTVITEPLGCSATESIVVNKDCYIDIPNAFSPNGDGINDFFFPRQLLSNSLTSFKMQIFNRWGQVIFETTKTDGRGWDGNFNGSHQPEGVYIYKVSATVNGEKEDYQGNITLIR